MASAVATLIAGLLADYVFVPAMMPGGVFAPLLGGIFGTGTGAGIALLYVITSMGLLLVGVGGYSFPTLRNLEDTIPDNDALT